LIRFQIDHATEREFFIDNLLFRIHFNIVMIRWTGLAPWEFGFLFPGSLTSTFLNHATCTPLHPGAPGVIVEKARESERERERERDATTRSVTTPTRTGVPRS